MHEDDAVLLSAWGAGDGEAGSRLFTRHYRSVYRFFSNKLASLAAVEDLVQQTFTACVEARARFRGDASFRTFVLAIARNLLLKHLRDRRKDPDIDADAVSLADCGLGASTVVGMRREQQLLLTALRRIAIDSQVVFEMTYWEQMPAREIAAILGETEAAIRGRLRKAKLELRGAIEALARTPDEVSSTIDGLDRWADGLRNYWDAGR
ncbi:RNA polymerase sigma factor [Nannocystis bainbridge]|uniref:Sigma-70 family RNA polymerase sigma factor n=1 Tax=Nannocystis bainbridge TaxID=2995303 RepID=A0ABT5E9S1_9BACT|nr:sigma-70 family RNA polymerase sigma factor [Nannocystis bainbridge]MDC0722109.1 sigma-70 family RNA polymerase sigma factor [Nannocystis bainbridge]